MPNKAAKKKAKKQAKKKENAQVQEWLCTPGTLPIMYTDLRETECKETKPLQEFLLWATSQKVVVLTESLHKCYTLGQMSTGDDMKIWCPFIETACLIPESIVEEIYPFRDTLFVDDMYKSRYNLVLKDVMEREKAYRKYRELMHAGDSEGVQSANVVPVVAEGVDTYISDTKVVAADVESALVGEHTDVQSADVVPVAEGVDTCISEIDVVAADVQSALVGEHADVQSVDVVPVVAEGTESLSAAVDVHTTHMPALSVVMSPDMGDWKLNVPQRTSPVAYDDLLLSLVKSVKDVSTTVNSMSTKVDSLSTKVDSLSTTVNSLKVDMETEFREVHKAISDNGEGIVRVALSTFLKDFLGPDVERMILPVLGSRLPFVHCYTLEALAKLCLKDKVSKKSKNVPVDVEIDVFVKIMEGGDRKLLHTPPRYASKGSPSTSSTFTSFLVGESTRSSGLCKASYMHPKEPECSASSKLLYKFVQLERGLMAARAYYGVDEESIAGGIIISPSFKNMSDVDGLVDSVLEGRESAFANIGNLHGRKRMWLWSL